VALLFVLLGTASVANQPVSAPPDQHVTVVFGVLTPDATPLRVEDFEPQGVLTAEDRQLLAQSLSSGKVSVRGSEASNKAGLVTPRARIIVLFTGPLSGTVRLAQPDGSHVLYVQEQESFRPYPSDIRILNRFVELTPFSQDRIAYSVEHATIGRTGGTVLLLQNTPPVRGLGGKIIAPRKIKDSAPVYPAEAISAGIEGSVILQIVVDESGTVSKAQVIRSLPMLDQAAIECVRQWKYTPALLDGVAVPMTLTESVRFRLR
jgi:TonB family protein